MSTQIGAPLLTELRAEGVRMASVSGPFVDPHTVATTKGIIARRGEPWVASVLGRDLTRRSTALPRFPWLTDGDMHTLVVADGMEDRVAFDGIVQADQ